MVSSMRLLLRQRVPGRLGSVGGLGIGNARGRGRGSAVAAIGALLATLALTGGRGQEGGCRVGKEVAREEGYAKNVGEEAGRLILGLGSAKFTRRKKAWERVI